MGMILDKLGIAVRTGTHCAEPVMTHYGITSMIRASLAMYNTIEEVDVFADGLIRALDMLRRSPGGKTIETESINMSLIVLEGLDGAGKSTQIDLLQQLLASRGLRYEYLHFPRFDAPIYGRVDRPLSARRIGSSGCQSIRMWSHCCTRATAPTPRR